MAILRIFCTKWMMMGFSKRTLHYLKKSAEGNKPFTINRHVRERLEKWANIK